MKILSYLLIIFISIYSYGDDISASKYARLIKRGENIAIKLCDKKKLPKVVSTESIDSVIKKINETKACVPLNKRNLKSLAYFLKSDKREHRAKEISVPKGAKCPVCGMFVSKYPKWASEMVVDGKIHYFDGVKDMMKYYIFDGDFPYDRKKIKKMLVTDFYTLEAIPAKEAYYVIGSKMYGPMGNELIPFKIEKEAEDFIKDHGGDRILRFSDITGKIVMGLDGIEYDDK